MPPSILTLGSLAYPIPGSITSREETSLEEESMLASMLAILKLVEESEPVVGRSMYTFGAVK